MPRGFYDRKAARERKEQRIAEQAARKAARATRVMPARREISPEVGQESALVYGQGLSVMVVNCRDRTEAIERALQLFHTIKS